jgi:hypothetical protein
MSAFEFKAASAGSAACGGPCTEGCVEVAVNVPGIVGLRDSKTGTVQTYTPDEWRGFVAGVKAGEFDLV